MALQISPELQEKIEEIGAHSDDAIAGEALEAAVTLLEIRERKLAWLRKELAIGEAQEKRGELITYTPETMERLQREAVERSRLGRPIKDAVKPPSSSDEQ